MIRLLPEVLGEHHAPGRVALELRVPEDLCYFDGHFPGLPILPGVVQVDWSVRLARARLPLEGEFSAARNLKFVSLVTPNTRLTLELEVNADHTQLSFAYACGGRKCSGGTLVFGA